MARYHISVERETLWHGDVVIEADSEAEAREQLEEMAVLPFESPILWEVETDEITITDVEELEE